MNSNIKKPSVRVGSNTVKMVKELAKQGNSESLIKALAPVINFHQKETYNEYILGDEMERESDVLSSMMRGLDEKTLISLIHENMFLNEFEKLVDFPFSYASRSGRSDYMREYFSQYYDFIKKGPKINPEDNFIDDDEGDVALSNLIDLAEGERASENTSAKPKRKTLKAKPKNSLNNVYFLNAIHKMPFGVYDSCQDIIAKDFLFEEHFSSNSNDKLKFAIENHGIESDEYKKVKYQETVKYALECKNMLTVLMQDIKTINVFNKKDLLSDYTKVLGYLDFFQCYCKASILGFEDIQENLKSFNMTPSQFIEYFVSGPTIRRSHKSSDDESIGHMELPLEINICQDMSVTNFEGLLNFLKECEQDSNIDGSLIGDFYSLIAKNQFKAWNKGFKNAFLDKSMVTAWNEEEFKEGLNQKYSVYQKTRSKMKVLSQSEPLSAKTLVQLDYNTHEILTLIFRTSPLNPNYLIDLAEIISPDFEFEFSLEYEQKIEIDSSDGLISSVTYEKKNKKLKFIDILNIYYYADMFTKKPIGYDNVETIMADIEAEQTKHYARRNLTPHYIGQVAQYKKAGIEIEGAKQAIDVREYLIKKYSLVQTGPDNVKDFFTPEHSLNDSLEVIVRGMRDLNSEDEQIRLENLFLKEKLNEEISPVLPQKNSALLKI